MTTFVRSPRILKGAIVYFDLPNTQPHLIVFQYNPATLSRTLQAQTTGGEGGQADMMRFKGAPTESLSLEVEIDAADQLEQGKSSTVQHGIYPQLAALEGLLYPSSQTVTKNVELLSLGIIEIMPPAAPFTLFVYGPRRILPIQLTELQITEEAHDPHLNPIRATVLMSLQALSYNDLLSNHPGHALFMAYQKAKEKMAQIGLSQNFGSIGTTIDLR
jgi:hypothetical protein